MAIKPKPTPKGPPLAANDPEHRDAIDVVKDFATNELVFGIVGALGSGTSEVSLVLQDLLDQADYDTHVIKARSVIEEYAREANISIHSQKSLEQTRDLQNCGDKMREKLGHSAIAERFAVRVRRKRASAVGQDPNTDDAIQPDKKKRAYILDSIRHPSEIKLLRKIYQQSFCVIGVVCEEGIRLKRLQDKFDSSGTTPITELMRRDERDDKKHGQQVSAAFHLSDFFVDNTDPRFIKGAGEVEHPNPTWNVSEDLGRLVDIVSNKNIVRPRPNETAMYHAHGARMRSSCLSRQVGAALLDQKGNILSTGTNEVPRAGGGVYGGGFDDFANADPNPLNDHRCFKFGRYCRNTRSQNEIIDNLANEIEELPNFVDADLRKRIRKTKIGQLIEFSRAVHAEMDALLSAAREGVSTVGSRLFVTTYPCHNCARHIVTAGVDEVQFIEPYLKSQALPLHGDAITDSIVDWTPPSEFYRQRPNERKGNFAQVLFRPFTGVAPRLYRRAFFKDRDLKDDDSGAMLHPLPQPEGESVPNVLEMSYTQIEAVLAKRTDQ